MWAQVSHHLARSECAAVTKLSAQEGGGCGDAAQHHVNSAAAGGPPPPPRPQRLGGSSGASAGRYARTVIDLGVTGGVAPAHGPGTAASSELGSARVQSPSLDALVVLTRVPPLLLEATPRALLSALADLAATDLRGALPSSAARLAAALARHEGCSARPWHMRAVAAALLQGRGSRVRTSRRDSSSSAASGGDASTASAAPSLPRLSTSTLARLLASCAVLGFRDAALLRALCARLTEQAAGLSSAPQLLSVAGACTQLGVRDAVLAHALCGRLLERLPHWTGKDAESVAKLAGALAGVPLCVCMCVCYGERFGRRASGGGVMLKHMFEGCVVRTYVSTIGGASGE